MYDPSKFTFTPSYIGKQEELSTPKSSENNSEGNESDIEAHCVKIITPMPYKESQNLLKKQKWQEAILNEVETLKQREVFELVPRPEKDRILESRWVYALKKDVAGKVKQGCYSNRRMKFPYFSLTILRIIFCLHQKYLSH